jgi:hypothetical protein
MTLEDPFLPLPPFQAFGIDLPKSETRPGALAVILAALAILALAPVVLVIQLVSLASEAAALLGHAKAKSSRQRPAHLR